MNVKAAVTVSLFTELAVDDWMLKQAEEARVFCGELGTSMARAILLQVSKGSLDPVM